MVDDAEAGGAVPEGNGFAVEELDSVGFGVATPIWRSRDEKAASRSGFGSRSGSRPSAWISRKVMSDCMPVKFTRF